MPADDAETGPNVNPLCGADPLARRLARLAPAPVELDRGPIWFAAGETAAAGRAALWKVVAAVQVGILATVIAFGLYYFDAARPAPEQRAEPPVTVLQPSREAQPPRETQPPVNTGGSPNPVAAAGDTPADRAKWLQLRSDVFTAGLGVLPTPGGTPPPADPAAMEKSLQLPPGVLAVPAPPAKPMSREE